MKLRAVKAKTKPVGKVGKNHVKKGSKKNIEQEEDGFSEEE